MPVRAQDVCLPYFQSFYNFPAIGFLKWGKTMTALLKMTCLSVGVYCLHYSLKRNQRIQWQRNLKKAKSGSTATATICNFSSLVSQLSAQFLSLLQFMMRWGWGGICRFREFMVDNNFHLFPTVRHKAKVKPVTGQSSWLLLLLGTLWRAALLLELPQAPALVDQWACM